MWHKDKPIKTSPIHNKDCVHDVRRKKMIKEDKDREYFFSQVNIEFSKSSYNLSKNLCNPTAAKAEQLDNWGKLLDLERLKNESDEDFRKRLSEKLPGKEM